jgi:hypothetical protein
MHSLSEDPWLAAQGSELDVRGRVRDGGLAGKAVVAEIGRASCRERVWLKV